MTEPLAELPDEVCFDLTEMGELLNLVEWLQDLLAVAQNPDGIDRVNTFVRTAQRRLWGDIQDVVDDSDEPDEG